MASNQYPLDQFTSYAIPGSLQEAIARENPKSARDQPDKLVELLMSDIQSGFAFVPRPTTKAVFKIPNAVIIPVSIVNQLMISNDGKVILKD
jgi:hypothetical protein